MNKRLLTLLLAFIIATTAVLSLGACTTPPTQEELCAKGEHIDENSDEVCDACEADLGEPDPTPTEYTFTLTVKDYLGNGIEGLKVKFLYNNSTAETEVVSTDASGKATVKIATEREVIAEFVDLEDWGTPKKKALTFEAMEYEKEVKLNPVVTIKLVDSDGAAIEGAVIALCNNGGCSQDFTSDANGECKIPIKPNGKYKLRVVSVPDGYTMPELIEGELTPELYDDYHAYFAEELLEFTFTIAKA